MKQTILFIAIFFLSTTLVMSQSMEDLKDMQTEKNASIADLQSQIDGLQKEVDGLQSEIDKLSGWRKGVNGLLGFDFSNSNGWVANPNPDARATSLNIGLTGYLLNDKEKTFWHNKGIVQKAWQDVDRSDTDRTVEGDGLFNNGTVDILNLSSLAGYKFSEKLAASGLAELNTSIENFLNPGTLDIGVGVTWLPIQNLSVVLHPLNYHFAFSGIDGLSSTGSLGAKFRVDYFNDFNVSGVGVNWTTTLTGFVPYSDKKSTVMLPDGTDFEAGLTEFSWINTLSFDVWKGIGVGIGWGLRNSKFESASTQSYTTLGLSYGF
mgnify:CR=1 FL=1